MSGHDGVAPSPEAVAAQGAGGPQQSVVAAVGSHGGS
jgi:hypothetical protein